MCHAMKLVMAESDKERQEKVETRSHLDGTIVTSLDDEDTKVRNKSKISSKDEQTIKKQCNVETKGVERARSRSRSPRGQNCNNKCLNDKNLKETKSKKAQKRKAKDDLDNIDQSKERCGPKPKHSKGTKGKQDDTTKDVLHSVSVEVTDAPKPKRKYVRKNKVQIESSQLTENSNVNSDLLKKDLQKSPKKKKDVQVMENGNLSEVEEQALSDKVRKKPGPKKGFKKKSKVEADSTTLPPLADVKESIKNEKTSVSSVTKTNSVVPEAEADSDTVDYSVTSGANSQPVEVQTSSKKVVKIDDIEIMELSDLNSSREESAEENDMDNSVEKVKVAVPAPLFISLDECEQPDKTFLCSYPNCKYRGKTRVALRKHLSHHQIFLCAHCEYHCNVFMELESHMVANHPQRWGRKKCKKCQRYIRGDTFDGHEEKCDGTMQFMCEKCDKVFKYESKLFDHENKFHASLKCEHCEFVAESKLTLNKHVTATHPKPKKPKAKKAAKMVKPEFMEPSATTTLDVEPAEIHVFPVKAEENAPRPASPVGTVLISPLEDTPEKVVTPTLAVRVASVDTTVNDDNLSSVTSIPVPFVEKENMQITSDSSGQVTLSIPEIPDSSTTNALMSPDSTTPMLFPLDNKASDNVQICDVEGCGQVLKTYRLLLNHKKSMHNILPSQQMHPCEHPDCNLVFKKKGQLKKHQVVHTGERKYICSYEGCGKAFRHNANLKIHNLLHTGEKPIKCKYCDFACRQKSSLIHHMKTKHKDVDWPAKGELQHEFTKLTDSDEKKNIISEGNGDKTDLESSTERVSEADLSLLSSKCETELKAESVALIETKNDNISSLHQEPKIEQESILEELQSEESLLMQNKETNIDTSSKYTPKNSSVTSQNCQPKLEGISCNNAPITLSTPTKAMVKAMAPGFLYGSSVPKAPSPAATTFSTQNIKTDVYDFDEEDETEPALPEPPKATVKKTPLKPKSDAIKLNEMNEDGSLPTKKKRGVKKKKDESPAAAKPESPKGKKTTPKKKKVPVEHIPHDDSVEKSDELLTPVSPSVGKPMAETEVSKPDIEPEVDSLVEEHVSENPPPLSATSSDDAPIFEEPEHAAFDDNMGPPHAPAPAYSHHDHSPLSGMDDETANPDDLNRGGMASPPSPNLDTKTIDNLDQIHKSPFSEISPVSQEQVLSNETNHALSSVTSMQSPLKEPSSLDQNTPLDMHVSIHRDPSDSFDMASDALSPHRKVHSSFELPNDIDPDEAAKILEESDEREKNMRNEKGHIREVGGEFVPVLHEVKDGYKYISSPTRSMPNKGFPEDLHLSHGPNRANEGENSPYEFPNYRQHHSEFSHIQGIERQAKDTTDPRVFIETSQRRPSSSYVPDFLPTIGTTSAGPPSVSSNYSSHSNPVSQNQTDLVTTYGASSAAGLPSYPPTSSVHSYIPPSAITSYPSTTSATSTSRSDPYRLTDSSTATTTTSSTLHPSSYPSRDLFPHYFQDPSLPLPPVAAQQDPRSLTYPPQQSSLQALQRSSADFLQRASAGGLPGMNYPSVTESLARLSQTSSQQPWIGHDDRSRPWAQASPILMPPEIDTASSLNRNPFSSTRPELASLDTSAKRSEPAFPGVAQTASGGTDRYDVASAYMGSAPFNPAATSNYPKSLTSGVTPQKQLEEAYRQSAAAMTDYRSLSHAAPSMSDMYSRMGMNPTLGLDKYYPYSREAMYRSQQLGSNPFMPPTSTAAQMPYADRDYARNPYAQDSAYGKYLPGSNLTQSLPHGLQGAGDYFQPRPGPPDPYIHDPYRRSVIHNMMSRFYN